MLRGKGDFNWLSSEDVKEFLASWERRERRWKEGGINAERGDVALLLESLALLGPDAGRDPAVRPTAAGELEVGVGTQQHVSLLLLVSLFSFPGHA